jgi:hypothetical protein
MARCGTLLQCPHNLKQVTFLQVTFSSRLFQIFEKLHFTRTLHLAKHTLSYKPSSRTRAWDHSDKKLQVARGSESSELTRDDP